MRKLILVITISISLNSLKAQTTTEKTGETVEVENKNIDWESFDETSTTSKNEIRIENIEGLWKAYQGLYKFGEHINAMKLTKPFIFEVKGSKYRRSENSEFKNFTIENNIITKKEKTKDEIGIINKITSTELIITWKDKSNYTRYIYTK